MNIGMLWFDNDSNADLAAKVERAASYYQKKYGKQPDLCFVHPSMAPSPVQEDTAGTKKEPAIRTGKIEVRTTRSVLPNHLWIGLNTNGSSNGHTKQ